jgi:pyruvate/2-oxoglutarate dehydrogenase complex dihydrolipoamide acyltransferase (E2) component
MKSRPRYSLSWFSRPRWNVLDAVQIVARDMVATYLFGDIEMTYVENLRKELGKRGQKPTITAVVLKAIAIAQEKHPCSRTMVLPFGRTAVLEEITAGFTCEKEVNGEPIVFFGVIKEPNKKTIQQIAAELRDYATAEIHEIPQLDKESKFSRMPWLLRRIILWLGINVPAVRLFCQPATFGMSSLGKYGIQSLIPPCVSSSVFGVGSVEERPVVRDGQIVARPMLTLSLNFDHRVIDGAPAALFFKDIRDLLEGGLAAYIEQDTGPETLTAPNDANEIQGLTSEEPVLLG